MATTLDPANIHNFAGVGTLSNGNLTLSSTGNSAAISTTTASGKKTFQYTISAGVTFWPTSGLSSSSASSDGFRIGFQSAWVIYDPSGAVVTTGSATPTPAAGMVVTVDVDTVGKTVSVRANGTTVLSNISVASLVPTTWRAIVFATDASQSGTTFSNTIAFSGLTYPPLSGYSSWDASGTNVSITGASVSALAGSAVPSVGAKPSGAAVSALAGTISEQISGSTSITGASAAALAGQATEAGSVPIAGAAATALAGAVAAGDATIPTGAAVQALAGTAGRQAAPSVAGASVAALAGSATTTADAGPTGSAVQALAGGVTTTSGAGATVPVTGAFAVALAGGVSPAASADLSGAVATTSAGPPATRIDEPATGAACLASAGLVSDVVSVVQTGATVAAQAGPVGFGALVSSQGASVAALASPVAILSSSAIALGGCVVTAVAGNVAVNIVEMKLNPNYIARGAPRHTVAVGKARSRVARGGSRRIVAVAMPRGRIVRAAERNRIVVGTSAMSSTNNLTPPIDATVEQETVTFDYGGILKPGITLTGTPTITCEVYGGTDPTPAARIIGPWRIGDSPNTGAPNAAVYQLVGNMLAGTTYRLQCVCATSDTQNLSLWTHLGCEQPD